MSIVFYPEMGVDLVVPLITIPSIEKIYCFGPLLNRFGKKNVNQNLKKHVNFMNGLLTYGNNSFYSGGTDEEQFVEFFPPYDPETDGINQVIKQHHFQRKELLYYQVRYFGRIITIYYYYNALVMDKEWPVKEKVDYVVHANGFSRWRTNKCQEQLRKILKPNTIIVAPKQNLINRWGFKSKQLKKMKPNPDYQRIVDRLNEIALDDEDGDGTTDQLPIFVVSLEMKNKIRSL